MTAPGRIPGGLGCAASHWLGWSGSAHCLYRKTRPGGRTGVGPWCAWCGSADSSSVRRCGGAATPSGTALSCLARHSCPLAHQFPEVSGVEEIALLRRMVLDIPVFLVRLDVSYVQRTLQQVSADLISEGRLVEQG